jgi:hypothetical protein
VTGQQYVDIRWSPTAQARRNGRGYTCEEVRQAYEAGRDDGVKAGVAMASNAVCASLRPMLPPLPDAKARRPPFV